MRSHVATAWVIGIALIGGFGSGNGFAQRRAATAQEALSYIYSAFLTQADPGVMSKGVALGPELQKGLALPATADGAKVYGALIAIAGTKQVDVRRATPQEVTEYGPRRGFDPNAEHPLYTLQVGELRFLVQYDLQRISIPFIGQLGVADPDPAPVLAKAETGPAPKTAPLSLMWMSVFEYNSATLTPEARARLDGEIIPKVAGIANVRFTVSGHSDRLGTMDYNRELSEKRAEAVRDYLLEKGVDAERIEIFGYGQTLPVKSCPEEKGVTLIDCLAPNRRVVVEIQAP
jgi:outer membrane protein OmpA-like peptidoglycan-associated protein